ncbi:uncharacterized protein LOC133201813 [Saccostrea echinata]|uniref:uncharacterized protein LOC133180535 n=1 Tax=Saccostrea echinata TaxID=191078 RepID=UPI002A82B2C8|nr:uncharacterized protein LOC133180535 [Saccostrea echinata]XP_061184453.1 uncharacterized protein LOC133192467 [Saccostrea echinata]XP_061193598.1 uncharacterized protein LOC133201813 [Saccostrea echinata]
MPACSCKQHTNFSKDETFKIYRLSSKKFKTSVVEGLIENGHLCKRSVYLCTACAAYSEKNLISNGKDIENELVEQIVNLIKTNNISDENVSKIVEAIGTRESREMKDDFNENIFSQYKNVDFLTSAAIDTWISERNNVVSSFLLSLCGKKMCDLSSTEKTKIVFAIEHLYCLVSSNIIMPFSFSLNLLTYYMSNSKTVCNMYSSAHPAGSYTSVLKWIEEHATTPITIPFQHDVITYFDNNQVLARNWRVRYDAKAILSYVTTVVHFFPNPTTDLQLVNNFSPRHWFYNIQISDKYSAIVEFINFYENLFRSLREHFIENRINVLLQQQHPGLTSTEDIVSDLLKNKKKKFSDNSRSQVDVYSFISNSHTTSPTIQMGNPISVNPCSFKSVQVVLENLKCTAGIPDHRKWSIVGCDGLPFLLSHRIIKDNPHLQDILLQPGLGHVEINMSKAVIKLLWQVIGVDLAKLLGYRSPKALQSCLDANDHHKAMQFIEILLFGTGDELLYPYVYHCSEREMEPSGKGFFAWCKEVKDPNYMFLLESIFTYALAVYLFRAGIRRNNSNVIMASRLKFSPLYFGVSKTNYQQIELLDIIMRVCAPTEVLKFIQEHESFTRKNCMVLTQLHKNAK